DRVNDVHSLFRQQPYQPFAQQYGVFGDHDPPGISTIRRVPPPRGLSTHMRPSSAWMRSRSPANPDPWVGSAPPRPLSRTSMRSQWPLRRMLTVASEP